MFKDIIAGVVGVAGALGTMAYLWVAGNAFLADMCQQCASALWRGC